MKIPQNIKTKHKIRDLAIIKLYLQDSMTLKDIGLRFGISATRVHQIVYKNAHLIQWSNNAEKAIRVNTLKRLLEKHPEKLGNKGTLEIIDQLRKEIEGDKPIIDQSKHEHVTVQINTEEFRKKSTKEKINIILGRA